MAGPTMKRDDDRRQSSRVYPVRNVDRRAAPLIIGILDMGDWMDGSVQPKNARGPPGPAAAAPLEKTDGLDSIRVANGNRWSSALLKVLFARKNATRVFGCGDKVFAGSARIHKACLEMIAKFLYLLGKVSGASAMRAPD